MNDPASSSAQSSSQIPDIPLSAASDTQSANDAKPRQGTIQCGRWEVSVSPGPYTSALVTLPGSIKVAEGQQTAKMDWNAKTTKADGPAWLKITDKWSGRYVMEETDGASVVATLGPFTAIARVQNDPLTAESQRKSQGSAIDASKGE
jgi:hypothetical protein